jgi:hypothetical protein
MVEARPIWRRHFVRAEFPPYPCPRCGQGILILDDKTLFEKRTGNAIGHFRAENYYHPMEDEGRFVCLLVCSNKICSEPVAMSGTTGQSTYYGPQNETEYENDYYPESIIPGPPLIDTPKGIPTDVREALDQSFSLFWTDLGSSANKLRVAGERLLTSERIKRFTINKKREREPMSFASRIQLYAKKHPARKEFLDALRWVGNVGSHGHDISRDDLLTGFELMEEGLRDLYAAKKRNELAKRGRDLVKRKGRPKKSIV